MQDLPVAIEVGGPLGAELTAWVESIGWQVVARDGGLPPRLVLAAAPQPGVAGLVVVVEGAPSAAVVRESLQAGAADVVGWPADRERLRAVPSRLPASARSGAGPRRIGVAGTGGGVGTSTVALAVGALLAWAGREVIVVGGEDLLALCGLDPWDGPGAGELALLDPAGAAAEVDELARPVPGVPGLRVLGGGPDPGIDSSGWPVDAVVADLRAGATPLADVVCARADVHLAAAAPPPERVLLLDGGPLDAGRVRAALGGPPAGRVATSARVARAGASGRVPSGLPGAWLRDLRSALVRVLR